jgi:hypothetical protein
MRLLGGAGEDCAALELSYAAMVAKPSALTLQQRTRRLLLKLWRRAPLSVL